jgi:large subunit ribosomal protein L24
MKEFSKKWVSSKAPKKQRKYRANAPLHLRRKMIAAHLSSELRKKHGKRAFALRVGDKVKVVRGSYSGTIGKVEEVDVKNMKVYVSGAERKKGEGQPASRYPVDPSNLKIIGLELSDKRREEVLGRK